MGSFYGKVIYEKEGNKFKDFQITNADGTMIISPNNLNDTLTIKGIDPYIQVAGKAEDRSISINHILAKDNNIDTYGMIETDQLRRLNFSTSSSISFNLPRFDAAGHYNGLNNKLIIIVPQVGLQYFNTQPIEGERTFFKPFDYDSSETNRMFIGTDQYLMLIEEEQYYENFDKNIKTLMIKHYQNLESPRDNILLNSFALSEESPVDVYTQTKLNPGDWIQTASFTVNNAGHITSFDYQYYQLPEFDFSNFEGNITINQTIKWSTW